MNDYRPVRRRTGTRPRPRTRPRTRSPQGCSPVLYIVFLGAFFLGTWAVFGASRFKPGPPMEPTPTTGPEVVVSDSAPPSSAETTVMVPGGAPQELPTLEPGLAAPLSDQPSTDVYASLPDLRGTNPQLASDLQHILDKVTAHLNEPGVVMLMDIPGQGRWIGASGHSDRANQTPMVPVDRFRIASLTKMFVATVVLQLAQEGHLRLDDTVAQWLPDAIPNGHTITIRQLLNHTSGLYDYLDGPFERRYFADDPPRFWYPHELIAHSMTRDPYFAPGEPGKWKYSNTNYILLGMIIEQATDSTLVQELRNRIFEPLRLENTFLEDYEEIPGGFVHGYIADKDYTYASLSTWAAGGIVSNVEDVATFMQALFAGRLLDQEMLSEMLAFTDMSGTPVYGLGIARSVEGLSLATQGVVPTELKYDPLYGHIGGLSGFKSVAGYHPDSGITVVVLMNQMYEPIVPIAVEGLDAVMGKTPSPESIPSPESLP